ncbi:MAG: hypothetical protein O3C40_27665 [Planctomycetota bacterium]|nr:hypothetical protein [Planctomycetota bacterium]
MRCFLLSLSAISLLLLPACGFRSSTPDAEVSPVNPTPVPDAPPVAAADEVLEQVEPAAVSSPAEPEFTLDPAPAPPTESSPERASAEEVLQSVARVLRGAVEGESDESDAGSQGSVFGAIGRALSKGFQEAAADESVQEE